MTISKKLQLTINPVSANGSLYVNTAWDKLNPLYCANQQFAYANLSGSNTYANTIGFSLITSTSSPYALAITSNNQSNVKLFVHYSNIPNSNVGRFITIKADYTSNTVSYLNESYNVSYTPDVYYLSDNKFLMLGTPANNTLSIQSISVNNTTGAITTATSNTLVYSSNNTINHFNARFTISRVNDSKCILYYVDTTTASNTGSMKAAVVDIASNGNITFGSPLVIASNPECIIQNVVSTAKTQISNTQQVFGVVSGANNLQMYYHNIGISGNTLSLGTNNISNVAYGNFQSIGDNYYLGTANVSEYVIYSSSNNITYISSVVVPINPLVTYPKSPFSEITYNNNQFGRVYIKSRASMSNTKLHVTTVNKSTNTISISASDFPIFEIAGKYNTASSSVYHPSGSGINSYPIYFFDSLLGTTRGLVMSVEIQNPPIASNTLPIIYRFVDGNANSQTISYSSPGSNTYVAPAAGQLFIQCYGPGGRGRLSNPNTQVSSNAYAGGGGGFSYKTISVTSSQNIGIVVGRSSNSTVASTNTTANTMLCHPGGDATTSAIGVSGNSSGGDLNANGAPGVSGAYTFSKGNNDASVGGPGGQPGPVRTGSGLVANTQSFCDSYIDTLTGSVNGEGKSQGTGGYRGELNVKASDGEVMIGFKPS